MILLAIIFGWLLGLWTLHWYYKSIYKQFVDEMTDQYRDALKKMEKVI